MPDQALRPDVGAVESGVRVGIFDSGIGGLTLLHEALRQLPEAEYLYYADVDHVPYGERSVEEVAAYSDAAVSFLEERGCDAVVIACNTATSAAAAQLRERHRVPIVGIEPAVKPAVAIHGEGRVLVIATPLTARERKLGELVARVDHERLVDVLALPELVGYAERGEYDSPAVRRYLSSEIGAITASAYSVLVYGCTHFNHFEGVLRDLFPADTLMIDGSEGTIRQLRRVLAGAHGDAAREAGSVTYYQSGRRVVDGATLRFYQSVMSHLDEIRRGDGAAQGSGAS